MKHSHYLLILAALLPQFLMAEELSPTEVIFIDGAEVSKAFTGGPPLISNSRYRVSARHRIEPGIAAIHDVSTDIFLVVEGTATLVTGGTIVEVEETAPGEFRGPKSEGGMEHKLTKGDVIAVPKGTAHWFSKVEDKILYYIIKVTE